MWGNKEQFLTAARELAQSRDEAAPGVGKILIMANSSPRRIRCSPVGWVTGASRGRRPDLEGGQSRGTSTSGRPGPGEEGGHGSI